jgi:WD40-like Beta Propeller Repeat
MKITSGIILFIYVSIGLMTSNANAESIDGTYRCSEYSTTPDTSLTNQFIKVTPFDLTILPPSSGVKFYKEGILFLSSTKSDGKMLSEHLSFGTVDTRFAVLNDLILENPQTFSTPSPFPFPSEAITFSSDHNTMFFTKYSKAEGGEKIYQAKLSDGSNSQNDWSVDSDPLSFCSGPSTYTHPALSADGKLMIFASNRPGSIGGMDLYASLKKDGTWSDPVSLGDAVNSTSNELYPYLDSENNLFFSSDNSQGYGGYDIYVCKYVRNTWEKPINLSNPINTRFDDVAFSIDRKDGKSAFYTVKQKSDIRSSQLYQITIKSNIPDNLLTLSQYLTRPDISQMVILALEPAVQATDIESKTADSKMSGTDVVTYRVQFMTSFNPRTRSQISINEKDYNVFEYLYSGAYRLCVGEFNILSEANEFKKLLIKNDYPGAVVLAFINDIIFLDPELLKEEDTSVVVDAARQSIINEPESTTEPLDTLSDTRNKELSTVEVIKDTVKATIPLAETKTIETVNPPDQEPEEKKDIVKYRVQIITNNTSKGSYNITINNKDYKTFEYFYVGAYRTCVGDFSTLVSAVELQRTCRKSGHPQAFVVAFKNDKRSKDPGLFK